MQTTQKGDYLQRVDLWQSFVHKAYEHLTYEQIRDVYYAIFRHDPLGMAWLPTESDTQNANLSSLMRKHDIEDYNSMYHWSVSNREHYWKDTIETLNIHFDKSPERILDLSRGGEEDPDWLPGASFNITKSCFNAPEDKTAIIASDEDKHEIKLSYKELHLLVNRVSNGLVNLKLQAEDRVVLYMPLCPESVAAYLGLIQAGMVPVLVADSFSPTELKKRIKSSKAKAIIALDIYKYHGKYLDIYKKIQEADAPHAIIVSKKKNNLLRQQDLYWEAFLGSSSFKAISQSPDALISVLFSSGTTSEPKAIPWTQLTPIKCAADAYYHQDVHPQDVLTWTTSMGWMMGPWAIFAALMNQATLALYTGSAAGSLFGKFVEESGITVLGTIPSLVKVWKNTKAMEAFRWKVRLFSSTGEPSQVEDYLYLMWLCRFQAPVIEYCGGTEIGGGYMTGTILQPASPATFTSPALGMELLFRDEESGNLSAEQSGEVFMVPPSIGLSQKLLNRDHHQEYYQDSPQGLGGKILRKHGDTYKLYPDILKNTIFYKSSGRADDSMNLGGIKISAVEIEKIINQHEAVYECAAVAVAPKEGGPEALIVFFIPTANSYDVSLLKITWQKMLSKTLNPLFRIHDVVKRDTLPRTASNKLMRRVLKREYVS